MTRPLTDVAADLVYIPGDHRRDSGEPTLAGWTITLGRQEQNGPNRIEVGRTVTGANGAYSFTGLAEGHYRVFEVLQSGWIQTYPTDSAGMHNLVISNGQPTWTEQDFGNTGGPAATGTGHRDSRRHLRRVHADGEEHRLRQEHAFGAGRFDGRPDVRQR